MCSVADEAPPVGPKEHFPISFGAKRNGLLGTACNTDWAFAEKHDLLTPVTSSGYSSRTEYILCDGRVRIFPCASSASGLKPTGNPF